MIGISYKDGDKRLDGGLSQKEIEIEKDIGDMSKIEDIGDGTLAGSVSEINSNLSILNSHTQCGTLGNFVPNWKELPNSKDIISALPGTCIVIIRATSATRPDLLSKRLIPIDANGVTIISKIYDWATFEYHKNGSTADKLYTRNEDVGTTTVYNWYKFTGDVVS